MAGCRVLPERAVRRSRQLEASGRCYLRKFLAGRQPLLRRRKLSARNCFTSDALSLRSRAVRSCWRAPGPVEPSPVYQAIFSLAGLSQLFQPDGRI